MIIDGEATAVRPGDVAYIPPYAEHELRNDSTDLLGAFFINVPVGEALRPLLSDAEPAARDAGLGS
jgi:quercetin dioxygenase-like cupin family protein